MSKQPPFVPVLRQMNPGNISHPCFSEFPIRLRGVMLS